MTRDDVCNKLSFVFARQNSLPLVLVNVASADDYTRLAVGSDSLLVFDPASDGSSSRALDLQASLLVAEAHGIADLFFRNE